MVMAGEKRAPAGWWKLEHIQRKWIKGRLYVYAYSPATQTETYLGAAEPVFGQIDRLTTAQKKKVVKMFNTKKPIKEIMRYIEDINGLPVLKQTVYDWMRDHGIEGRWIK